VASVKEIVAFLKDISTSLSFILGTVTAESAGKVPKITILLLEVTQARRD
jgi:hypothetical protein